VLPLLCRELEHDAVPLLRALAPPFSLVWVSKERDEAFVQIDGLGQAPLFEREDDRLWALTNKVLALKALGVALEPEPEEWAVRSTLGWFPRDLTGYRRVRRLEPGTQIRLDGASLTRTRHDVLGDWVRPEPLVEDCLELARVSLQQVRALAALAGRPSVGLSGGWDSRAVVATLRAAGASFSARVRGAAGRPDVVVASELAGMELRVRSGSLPPEDPADCSRSIALALAWQAGHMVSKQHKSFLRAGKRLDGGVVNVMGQYGEIGRSPYARKIGALGPESRHEDALVEWLLRRMPPFLRPA
jgi:hypothetical protein